MGCKQCVPCVDACDFWCLFAMGVTNLFFGGIAFVVAVAAHQTPVAVLTGLGCAALLTALFMTLGRYLCASTSCCNWWARLGDICVRCWCCKCHYTRREMQREEEEEKLGRALLAESGGAD